VTSLPPTFWVISERTVENEANLISAFSWIVENAKTKKKSAWEAARRPILEHPTVAT
jgi:hypothetical protein